MVYVDSMATKVIDKLIPQYTIFVSPIFTKDDTIRTYNNIGDAIKKSKELSNDIVVLIEIYPGIYEEDLVLDRPNFILNFRPGAWMKGTSNATPPVLSISALNCLIYNFYYGDFTGRINGVNDKEIVIDIQAGSYAYLYNTVISKCVSVTAVNIATKYVLWDSNIPMEVKEAGSCQFFMGNIDAGTALAIKPIGKWRSMYLERVFNNMVIESGSPPGSPPVDYPVISIELSDTDSNYVTPLVLRGVTIANGYVVIDPIFMGSIETENVGVDLESLNHKISGVKTVHDDLFGSFNNLGLASTTETIAEKYIFSPEDPFTESDEGVEIDLTDDVNSIGIDNIPPLATGMYVNAYIKSDSKDSYFKIWKYGESDSTQCITLYPQLEDNPIEIQFPIGISFDKKLQYSVEVAGENLEKYVEIKLALLGWFFGRDERPV